MQKVHFQRWLALFNDSADALFSGLKAGEARTKAQNIGAMFEHCVTPNPLSLLGS